MAFGVETTPTGPCDREQQWEQWVRSGNSTESQICLATEIETEVDFFLLEVIRIQCFDQVITAVDQKI